MLGTTRLTDAKSLLQLLVHRGQDASGISWLDDYNVHRQAKAKGPPAIIDVPDEKVTAFIGSTRYPTLGDRKGIVSKEKYAQPFSYQTKLGTLSLAHNGNITNMGDISGKVYQSDAELLTELLGSFINETGSLEESLKKLVEVVDGAYSIVGILGQSMFCFRDPRGIRPLVCGQSSSHFVTASESLCLQQAGVEGYNDVAPGELIVAENSETTVRTQIVPMEQVAHCYFEYVYFASSVSTIDERNVYKVRLNLGAQLATDLSDLEFDFVVPVPDTSKAAAETIGERLQKPLREAIMKNRSSMRTFIMPGKDEREVAAKSKYLFVDEFITGRKLLLVDDSIVRGTTMRYLIQLLRDKGAIEVHVAITCPPQRFACYYGVDFGTDAELIARDDAPTSRICAEIGADSLTYLSIEGLLNAVNRDDLCLACLTGDYPTPNGKLIRLKIAKGIIDAESTHYE